MNTAQRPALGIDGPTHTGSEANALIQGDLRLMAHIRGIADQLHERDLLLQLIDGVFIVRDSDWVRENLQLDAVTDDSGGSR